MSEKTEGQRRIDGYRLATESLQKHARKMDEARRAAAERDARESAVCYDPSHDALTSERDEAVRERDGYKALVIDLLPHVSLAILPGPLDARLVRFVDSLTTDKAAQE